MSSHIVLVELIDNGKKGFLYLLKKWLPILLFSLVSAVTGGVFVWLQDPKFTAEIKFVAEGEQKSSLGGYASIASQFGIDIGGGSSSAFSGDNLVELFKTSTLLYKTLLSNNGNKLLIDSYIENHKIKTIPKGSTTNINFATALTGNYNRDRDSIINLVIANILKTQLSVEKIDKKMDIISIKMQDNNEAFAVKFIEVLSAKTIAFYTEYKTHKNQANVNVLQHQVDSVKAMLFGNINEVAAISDLNVNPLKQTLRTEGQKRQVDLQVNSVLYTELLKNLELSKLSLRKETPLIQVIDKSHLPLKNEKKGRLFAAVIGGFLGGLLISVFFLMQFFYFPKAKEKV